MPSISLKPDYAAKSRFKTSPKTTVKLNDLLKVEAKKESSDDPMDLKPLLDEPFTPEELKRTWMEFAEQRKIYQAEYQLLSQPYVLQQKQVVVQLLHPVQETMLSNMKSELTTFLREKLKNNSIIVLGEVKVIDDKKIIYTNREKFEYLANINPALHELKDRLGLDTDF